MSEYELSLLRQRGIAARDVKVQRRVPLHASIRILLNELGEMEIDPDEVTGVVRLVFTKIR